MDMNQKKMQTEAGENEDKDGFFQMSDIIKSSFIREHSFPFSFHPV